VKIHPRYFVVAKAECDLVPILLDFSKRHDLTIVEMIGILLGAVGQWHKYALRAERHPKDRTGLKKADEA
jgi:hypothetical protein